MANFKHKKTGKLYSIKKIIPKGIDISYYEARPVNWIGKVLRLKNKIEISKEFKIID